MEALLFGGAALLLLLLTGAAVLMPFGVFRAAGSARRAAASAERSEAYLRRLLEIEEWKHRRDMESLHQASKAHGMYDELE